MLEVIDTFTLVKLARLYYLLILVTLATIVYHYRVYFALKFCANERTLFRTAGLSGLVGALQSDKILAN